MLHKIARYWRTVKYLKPVQVWYQLYYRLKRLFGKRNAYSGELHYSVNREVEYAVWIPAYHTYEYGTFSFLNKSKSFNESIDWNFSAFGKLWTYNLNYFDYLLQPKMNRTTGVKLIYDFIDNIESNKTGLDPYTISLRTINWIKFCVKFDVVDTSINESLYQQLLQLENSPEYHLMGNHLLENGYSLLMGGIYFENAKFLIKGREILEEQLDEQVLDDGGHFERSPMYHQILLSRLLDCYNFLEDSSLLDENFKLFLKNKAESMLGWLNMVTFKNGTIPHVNDSTEGIAPATAQLTKYAQRLGLEAASKPLKDSGYRMIKNGNYQWFIDVGNVGPDYIPGHAHSDTFSFIFKVRNEPIIIDTGISTYEECDRRLTERSTASHNTVMINKTEQTEVWKAFRVGRRAHVIDLQETKNSISASHDGYKHLGCVHQRTFEWSENQLIIRDTIEGSKDLPCTAFFHFHPQVEVEKDGNTITANGTKLFFKGVDGLKIKPYQFATGFNRLEPASVVEIGFRNNLESKIVL